MSKQADSIAAVAMLAIIVAATGLIIVTVEVWTGLIVAACAAAFACLASVPAVRRTYLGRNQAKVSTADLHKPSRPVSTYKVTWSARAIADLQNKIPSMKVIRDIVDVSATELRAELDPNDADEGSADPGYFWRRAIRRDVRKSLSEGLDDSMTDNLEAAWNYVLVYRKMTQGEGLSPRQSSGFNILAVLSNREIAKYLLATTQSNSPLAMAERARQAAIEQENEKLIAQFTAEMDAELDGKLTRLLDRDA